MDYEFAGGVLTTILKIICLGALGLAMMRWRRAKKAGENSSFASWPFGLLIAALIMAQVVVWIHGSHQLLSWIGLGIASLLLVMGGVGLLKWTWRLDRKA